VRIRQTEKTRSLLEKISRDESETHEKELKEETLLDRLRDIRDWLEIPH